MATKCVFDNNQNDMTPLSIHAFQSMNFFVLFLSIAARRKYEMPIFMNWWSFYAVFEWERKIVGIFNRRVLRGIKKTPKTMEWEVKELRKDRLKARAETINCLNGTNAHNLMDLDCTFLKIYFVFLSFRFLFAFAKLSSR